MIRIILCSIALIFFFTIYQINLLIYLIISIFSKDAAYHYSQKVTCIFLNLIILISGAEIDIVGSDNLDNAYKMNEEKYKSKKGIVFISNHRSLFDVICGYPIMKTLTGFIAKAELKRFPFFTFWLGNDHCLLIDRNNPREGMKIILKAIEYINSGISMWIFPEGTRAKKNETIKEFKEGSFVVATKTGAVVVPIIFINTDNIFENHFPLIKKTKIKIIIEKPIDVAALSNDEKKNLSHMTYELIRNTIENNINTKQFS